MSGKVYLVGAGPGDPELLTLKGQRVLAGADVVVYDRLANPRLLDYARADAERVYVGKEAQRHALAQDEINVLLSDRARAGQTVCRLKGGDPFLFGRGGEEAEALTAAGIDWEYVPGVTSAIAVPGYAGIPVTHRGASASLAIAAGYEDPAKGASSVPWEALAGAQTLVVMMGAERLGALTERLISLGRATETPAAAVSWGTYPRQTTITGTLGDLAERCREAGCPAPAILVIGEVAALRERLRWWDRRPLFGKRIVVTRSAEQADDLVRRLEAAGAEAIVCPTIRIQPLANPDLSGMNRPYSWVVFTSANGVYLLTVALRRAGRDVRALGTAKVAAIGPETARAAEAAGLRVDFTPTRFVAEQIAAEFPEPVAGLRILIPRAREARETLPELWRAQGAGVDVLPVYETVPDESAAAALRVRLEAGEVDAVTFTASSTVRNFASLLAGVKMDAVRVACIGPVTASTARELGLRVDVVADRYTIPGLVEALEKLYAEA